MLIPVILSGGSGTRLWPLSRKLFPKQLMPILGGKASLLQATLTRAHALDDVAPPIVVTNELHRFLVASQLQEAGIEAGRIILEPESRNTAPAAATAALAALETDDDPYLLLLPADHFIRDPAPFLEAVNRGRRPADQGRLVTFGIVPDKPETGFGYIRKASVPFEADPGVSPVERFVEKPDLATALGYVSSGEYLWNSGVFLFKASAILAEFERFAPATLAACRQALVRARKDLDFLRLDAAAFHEAPEDSVDYAIMEKTDRAVVVSLDCGWSDVGSWSAVYAMREKDDRGNVCLGDVLLEDSSGCYLHSTSRLVAALGIADIALVETKDAVLVASLDRVQDVKAIVGRLRRASRPEAETHCKVYRPWGYYEGIDSGDHYQVKRITVYPDQKLSLQKHYHRAEHWVIVKGSALVTRDAEELLLTEDQSAYIPLGTVHRLYNPGKINLELIEIQTGSYLGEDDIVRLDDIYGRRESES